MKNTRKAFAVQKDACTNMQRSTALNITLLISTVSASFVGAKCFGISVPVVGQLPLTISLRGGSRLYFAACRTCTAHYAFRMAC